MHPKLCRLWRRKRGERPRTFEQTHGGLGGQGEGVERPCDVQQALEVLGHVISAHGADVVDGLGCCGGQGLLPEPLHQVVEHRVWTQAQGQRAEGPRGERGEAAAALLPRKRGFRSTTSLISPTSSMLVKRTAMCTFSGSRTTCWRTSDRVGLFSLEEREQMEESSQGNSSPPQQGHLRVHALGDGSHDEEDGLGHLPGRAPFL